MRLAQAPVCSPEASLFPPLIISQCAIEISFSGNNLECTNWSNTGVFISSQKDYFWLSPAVNILKVTAITALLLRMKQTLWAAVVFFWMQQPQKRFPRRCYCDIRREGNTHSINNHFTGDRKIIYCVFIVLGRRSRLVHGEKNQHGSFGDALMIFI